MVPVMGSMPSMIRLTEALNLRNTWPGIFIMKMTFTGGNSFLIFGAAFKGLDNGYKEAATIDGAGDFQVMVQIMFPLVKSLIFTFIIFIIFYYKWRVFYYCTCSLNISKSHKITNFIITHFSNIINKVHIIL